MKQTIILVCVVLTFLKINTTYGWDTTHAKYFPLEVGNVFVYNWIYYGNPPGSGVYRVKIVKDTIIYFKRYFKASPNFVTLSSYSSWLRVDSLTGNIYQYAGTGGCSYNPEEYLVDSLRANLFDTARTCNSANDDRKCYDTGSVSIFGNQTSKKDYNVLIFLDPTLRRYAKNFGIIYSSYGDPYPTYNTLIGCVINGVVYGDTSVPTGLNTISTQKPVQFKLYQNYPNPFNPVTNIRFDIPRSSHVNLIIYDALGREVATLVNEKLSAGSYKTEWDATNYPNGVYFYRVETNNFRETKRMVLVK